MKDWKALNRVIPNETGLDFIVPLVHIYGPMKGEIQEFLCHDITIGRHPLM